MRRSSIGGFGRFIWCQDEPWNGPNNRKLANWIGNIYLRSGLEANPVETTSFVAVVGAQTTRMRPEWH